MSAKHMSGGNNRSRIQNDRTRRIPSRDISSDKTTRVARPAAQRHANSSPNAASASAPRGYGSRVAHASAGAGRMATQPSGGGINTGLVVRVVLLVLLFLVLLFGVCGALTLSSAKSVKEDAQTMTSQLSTLKQAFKDNDSAALKQTALDASETANHLNNTVHGIPWTVSSFIPFIGNDIRCAQTLGEVAQDLTDNALVPITNNSDVLNLSTLFADSKVNTDALSSLSQSVEQAAPVVERCAEKVSAMPTPMTSQVKEAVDKIKDPLVEADATIEFAEQIVPLLPQMLGANGQTRNYLIVGQTNAEMRPNIGLPGAWGIVSITDGQIEMGDFTTLVNHTYDGATAATTAEQDALFPSIGSNGSLATWDPNWPSSAQLCCEYWAMEMNENGTPENADVQGVITCDPIFMQHLLGLTGPVTTEDGTELNGDNAAREVMYIAYERYGSAADDFFNEAAQLSFHSLMDNLKDVSMADFMTTITEDGSAKHFQVWASNEDEERVIENFDIDGEVTTDVNAAPEVGVYIGNSSWSKLEWWLDINTSTNLVTENGDGSKTYQVQVDLVNTLTWDGVEDIPDYMTAYNDDEVDSYGEMYDYLYFYAPAGGSISLIDTNTDIELSEGSIQGIQVLHGMQHISPEQTASYTFQVTTSPTASGELFVRTTPTVTAYR